jgi:CRP-like cAMP-binding protein
MADSSILEKAVDAIVVLNAAFTNIRLYPPTSAMIVKSIDSADSILQGIFGQENSVVFAESEQQLIVSGHRLDEKNNKRPQVLSFIQVMRKLGLKSIAFKKGLEKTEILSFLEVIAQKPEDLRKQGGVQMVMSGKNIKNILFNQTPNAETGKGRQTADAGDVKNSGTTAIADKEQYNHIKAGIESIIKGDENAFRDRLVMQALPKAVFDFITRGKEKTADAVLNRLGAGLLNKQDAMRGEASLAFARIGAKILSEKRAADLIKFSSKLVEWIRFETILLPAYKHITHQLQLLSQYLILNHRLMESMEILKVFYMIKTGELKKDESIKTIAEDILQGMTRDEIWDSLLKDFQTDKNGIGEQALEILVVLGPGSAGVLISLLGKISGAGASGDPDGPIRLRKLCDALGRIGSLDAVPALRAIMEKSDPQSNDQVKAAAGNALEMILKIHDDLKKAGLPEKKEMVPEAAGNKIEAERQSPAEDEYFRQLSLVDQHVKNKDTGPAAKLLFEMIVKYAGEKDFEKAESLRDKLMDVEPMALSDIIKSGEIIEEEKSKSIDQAHMKLWSELYKNMTAEERSTLFFAMKSIKYDAGHTIFKKGDHDSRLYLINKGQIKLVFQQGDKEIFIKELKPGDMLGEDAFFSLFLSTTTAITLSAVELNYLEKDILSKWELKSYGVEPKLHDYYLKTKKIDDTFETKGSQQRTHERVAISGKVRVQFMDSSGIPVVESIIGALSDISEGGMSFYLNIKKERITKMFIEPRLNLKFSLIVGSSEQRFDLNGTMVAAIPHYYDYSIHVKFDNRLDKQVIEGVKRSNRKGEGDLEILTDS